MSVKAKRFIAILSFALVLSFAALAFLLVQTRDLYLSRAQARLTPVDSARYAPANLSLVASSQPRVVFFGDSRVEYWRPRPNLENTESVFRGVPGETTAQMRFRFADDVLQLRPAVVVIQAGINDLVAGAVLGRKAEATSQVVSNLVAMAESAAGAGAMVVLLTVVRPARPELYRAIVWSDDVYAMVGDVNAQLLRISTPRVKVLDIDGILAHGEPMLPARYRRDTLHLNADAYELLNRHLSQAVMGGLHALQ